MEALIILFVVLFTKHFVFDFILQGPYQFLNKGEYGHPGGVLHSFLQILGSGLCLWLLGITPKNLGVVLLVEFVVHYHVDWAKVQLNRRMEWKPSTHPEFWWLLGFDQYLHYLTYAWMVWMLTRVT